MGKTKIRTTKLKAGDPLVPPSLLTPPKPPQQAAVVTKNAGIGEKIYDGTAALGRFTGFLSFIFGTIIAIFLVCIGVWLLFRKDKYTGVTTGVVTAAKCESSAKSTDCNLTVEYTVDSKKLTISSFTSGKKTYKNGDTLSVRYDPANPTDASTNTLSSRTVGFILIGVGILIALFSFVYYYMVSNYKIAAAAAGVHTVYEVVT
jgi:uncharacterized membrane protein